MSSAWTCQPRCSLERGAFESDDPAGITYVQANGTEPTALQGEVFDRVVCNFGLSDIDDFDGIIATFTRVLEPGGVFVFSIMHPCFPGWADVLPGDSPPDGGYFTECWWVAAATGPSTDPRNTVGTNHRMVSTYFNKFAARRAHARSSLRTRTRARLAATRG